MPPSVTMKQADITKGSKDVSHRIKDIKCLQVESNQYKRLGDYWEKKTGGPVVFIMFRRWGCAMCRMSAANFSALKPEFDKLGITMVGIGMEKLGYEEFVKGGYFDGELIVDEKKETYTALSCVQNTWRNFWGLFDGEILRILNISKKKGYENVLKGQMKQLGGTFVLAPSDGALLYGHYQTAKSFEPSMTSILTSLGVVIPENYDPYAAENPPTLKKLKQEKDAKEAAAAASNNKKAGSSPDEVVDL